MRIANSTFNSSNKRMEKDNILKQKLLFFILWPFGAWLACLKSAKTKSSYTIFFLFSLLICWHMTPASETLTDDFNWIIERFQDNTYTGEQILNQINAYFSGSDDAPKELYENILNWFVKLFSDNYHSFFLVASIPVAYLQLKAMKFITNDPRFHVSFWSLVLLLMFIFPRDIITIQNPRFATGFWIAITFSLQYFCNQKKWKYLIPICLTPFIHSGMWVYVYVIILFLVIPKKTVLLEWFAIISIPFIFFNADLFKGINLNFLPPALRSWAERQMSDDMYATQIAHIGKSGFWWVAETFDILIKIAYIYITIQFIKNNNYIKKDQDASALYHFYLYIFAIINLLQFVPVLGERYFWFTRVFCILIWFKAFALEKKHINELKFLLIACSWALFNRYGYINGGALAVTTPIDLFFAPLPYLIGKILI